MSALVLPRPTLPSVPPILLALLMAPAAFFGPFFLTLLVLGGL